MKFVASTILIFLISYYSAFSQLEIASQEVGFSNLSEQENITSPNLSFDGQYLIFTVKEDATYKIYESKNNNGRWSTPIELSSITKFLGATTYKNAPAYNHDASKIYFSAQNGTNTDIFVSSRKQSGWTQPQALPKTINTNSNEDEPSISPDNNKLFFTRFLDTKDSECGKIFLSIKDENFEWTKSNALVAPLNDQCERSPRIMADNKTLLFSSKRNKEKKFTIYYAKNLYSDVWLLPQPVATFSKQNALYPSVDYTGKTIYFASVTSNKKAKIHQANFPPKYKPDDITILTGQLTTAGNTPLGGTISLLNKISMVSTGKYHTNKNNGKYKIFLPLNSEYLLDFSEKKYSHKLIDYKNKRKKTDKLNVKLFEKITLWLKIYDKDIFQPINTKINLLNTQTNRPITFKQEKIGEGRYKLTIPIGEKITIELTSEYSKPHKLDIDLSGVVIFKELEKNVEITSNKAQYKLKITDADNNKGISCKVTLTNLSTAKKITTTVQSDQNGNAEIYARKGDKYDLTANPQGYAFYNTTFKVEQNTNSKTINIKLQALKQDVKIKFENITFETNSADLNEASNTELNKIVELLTQNPEIKVEISAHTDDVGSDSYNLKLSEKRAKSVVDYLILHDIETQRLIFKGYGESQPLFPNNSEENRSQNRRVELKITEISN